MLEELNLEPSVARQNAQWISQLRELGDCRGCGILMAALDTGDIRMNLRKYATGDDQVQDLKRGAQ